jgi:transcriptional regulator with XRE-family HTH domain
MNNDNNVSYREEFKIATIRSGLRQKDVANRANALLPEEQQVSELDISKFIHARRAPTPEQSKALASILNSTVAFLFPDLKPEGKE